MGIFQRIDQMYIPIILETMQKEGFPPLEHVAQRIITGRFWQLERGGSISSRKLKDAIWVEFTGVSKPTKTTNTITKGN